MKEKIFNDIYNQYTPDKQVVNRLFERIETEKPKSVSFKPIIAAASAAAGLALCFAAWKLLPSGPNIEVQTSAALTTTPVYTTTASYKSNIIINTEPVSTFETPPGATTAPAYGPETEISYKSNVITHTLPTNNPDAEYYPALNPVTNYSTVPTTSSIPENPAPTAFSQEKEDITAKTQLPVVTTASFAETSDTTTLTAEQSICSLPTITTLPVVTETITVESTEEESEPEVAYEDKSDMIEMPMFDTFGEYCDYFKLWDKLDNVRFECQIVSEDSTTRKNAEIDRAIVEEVLLYLKNCKFNYNAGYHYKNIRLHINDEICISIQKSGAIQIHVDNYDGPAVFEGDPEVYNKLLKFGKSIDDGEVIPHITIDESNYSDDDVPPGQLIEPD